MLSRNSRSSKGMIQSRSRAGKDYCCFRGFDYLQTETLGGPSVLPSSLFTVHLCDTDKGVICCLAGKFFFDVGYPVPRIMALDDRLGQGIWVRLPCAVHDA